ncbi:MAG: quinone oxidoreductase [Betaproteobacteria bacterium]|nr:quinone oxidoreductase [Betaproteobacteria bacterium]
MSQTAKAVQLSNFGGPEVMKLVDVTVGDPGPGQARVRHHAIGLNFIDIYQRSGVYPNALPAVLGMEGAGVVEAVGPGVSHIKPGDRVAYANNPMGSYAESRVMPAWVLVKIPKAISFEVGASMMLKGATAHYLFKRTANLQKGHTVLFHAAAGGVGLIAMQLAKLMGVTIIGTVGSDDKAKLAKKWGCTHTINYAKENFVDRVKEITKGRGVDVVYDSVGKDTFQGSLDCLRRYGLMVSFGNASGKVPPVDFAVMKGSLFITRPSLMAYTSTREDLELTANDLVKMVASKKLVIPVERTYKLADVQQAHRDLEGRKTTGCSVLIP